ncbi:MAG: dTDP-4-dehydrorhamnose 3,5-epimerase [Bdellovibrionales bacterium]
MNVIDTDLPGVRILEPKRYKDNRGYFYESFNELRFSDHQLGGPWVQDNQSFNLKCGTLRGLHFQRNPKAQTKIVRCVVGSIYDVAVDLRKGSPTYLQYVGVELSDENDRQLVVPQGFAHGFQTLTDKCIVMYKVDEFYSQECEQGVLWSDPEVNVKWPIPNPILSEKDANSPLLKDVNNNFEFF